MNQFDNVTPETAGHVLRFYGQPGGHEAGSFVSTLLEAYGKADPGNAVRLARGFPGYAAAMDLGYAGRFDELRQIADNTMPTCRHCGAWIESYGDRWVDVISGDHGGTYDICPERYDAATDTNLGHQR